MAMRLKEEFSWSAVLSAMGSAVIVIGFLATVTRPMVRDVAEEVIANSRATIVDIADSVATVKIMAHSKSLDHDGQYQSREATEITDVAIMRELRELSDKMDRARR